MYSMKEARIVTCHKRDGKDGQTTGKSLYATSHRKWDGIEQRWKQNPPTNKASIGDMQKTEMHLYKKKLGHSWNLELVSGILPQRNRLD